jgi:DNA invertase Pin-like site-specific DNA recombinase
MARGFCNDEARLCARFDERAGYRGAGLGVEVCWLREDFSRKGIRWEMGPTRTPSTSGPTTKGDILIVARLDRLSRSLRDVLAIIETIQEAEAGFRSLTEAIDTTTAPGRMMMQMVGAFAEFERAILRERTKAGLDAARKRGCIGGRRPKLRPVQQDEIVSMVSTGTKTAADAARLFNVHPATVSRILARAGAGAILGVAG